eukprot:scaffold9537_cov140-Isochrysis_galbana.AAC.3
MEQSPADARAAPSASGPTDMATETPPSPKRPRGPSSGNKARLRCGRGAVLGVWRRSCRERLAPGLLCRGSVGRS